MAKRNKKAKSEEESSNTTVEASENVLAGIASAADALSAFEDSDVGVNADAVAEELGAAADTEADEAIEVADELTDEDIVADTENDAVSDSELEGYASAEIEDIEELSEEKIVSVVESLLFAADKPQSITLMKAAFAGTKVRAANIRAALEKLQIEYSNPNRGVELAEVAGGYQIRTKSDNATYMQRTIKARPFKLSGPALEVMSIVAYKQPCTKSMVDDIRGVESGHLMRGLLERGLITFGEKSDLPGRPMYYETTRKFLETFGLLSLQELPTLNEIDQLLPEGIDEVSAEKKQTLSDLTGELSQEVGTTYSEGEQELMSISEELQGISLTTQFFEDEKKRQREKRDLERAQEIRERLVIGEEVDNRDKRWLERYEQNLAEASAEAPVEASAEAVVSEEVVGSEEVVVEAAAENEVEATVEEAAPVEAEVTPVEEAPSEAEV